MKIKFYLLFFSNKMILLIIIIIFITISIILQSILIKYFTKNNFITGGNLTDDEI